MNTKRKQKTRKTPMKVDRSIKRYWARNGTKDIFGSDWEDRLEMCDKELIRRFDHAWRTLIEPAISSGQVIDAAEGRDFLPDDTRRNYLKPEQIHMKIRVCGHELLIQIDRISGWVTQIWHNHAKRPVEGGEAGAEEPGSAPGEQGDQRAVLGKVGCNGHENNEGRAATNGLQSSFGEEEEYRKDSVQDQQCGKGVHPGGYPCEHDGIRPQDLGWFYRSEPFVYPGREPDEQGEDSPSNEELEELRRYSSVCNNYPIPWGNLDDDEDEAEEEKEEYRFERDQSIPDVLKRVLRRIREEEKQEREKKEAATFAGMGI